MKHYKIVLQTVQCKQVATVPWYCLPSSRPSPCFNTTFSWNIPTLIVSKIPMGNSPAFHFFILEKIKVLIAQFGPEDRSFSL